MFHVLEDGRRSLDPNRFLHNFLGHCLTKKIRQINAPSCSPSVGEQLASYHLVRTVRLSPTAYSSSDAVSAIVRPSITAQLMMTQKNLGKRMQGIDSYLQACKTRSLLVAATAAAAVVAVVSAVSRVYLPPHISSNLLSRSLKQKMNLYSRYVT